MIEIPELKLSKKVKSMQMFHQPVESATQGDRLGICVTQFDPSLIERCIASSPGYLQMIYGWLWLVGGDQFHFIPVVFTAAVIKVFKIPYYKSECKTGGKFHGDCTAIGC